MHPEGIKGAQAVAAAIFMARQGGGKEEIKEYVEARFAYNLGQALDEIRLQCRFDETCQGSVPQAIIAFLESEDFEDGVRKTISIGGGTAIPSPALPAGSPRHTTGRCRYLSKKRCGRYCPPLCWKWLRTSRRLTRVK